MLDKNNLKVKNWLQNKEALKETVDLANVFFVGKWQEESVLDWLNKLNQHLEDYNPLKIASDLDTAFVNTVLNLLDYNLLSEIKDVLTKLIANKTEAEAQKLDELIKQFEPDFSNIAAVLLCSLPTDTSVALEEIDSKDLTPGFYRFLGQSVLGHEHQVSFEAFKILESSVFNNQKNTTKDKLIFIAVIFLAYNQFKSLSYTQQIELLLSYFWSAIEVGVPVAEIFAEQLLTENSLVEYINTSILWGKTILESKEVIFIDKNKQNFLVGDLVIKYLIMAGNDILLEDKQNSYLEKIIKENNLNSDKKEKLISLLSFYLRLSTCSLVDYNGLLHEQGLVKTPFDWQELINNGISDLQAEEIKKYFSQLHQSLSIKIEIVNSLQTMSNWREEPYFERMLALSQSYEDVCGLYFGPLVYFDGEKDKWDFYVELPNGLKEKFEESFKKYGIKE
ncbi:MAG: hypothetical protein US42_C0003G0048 [Candidatus Magasanikbacteria bacterium GW2011_GWC2_37_14]|uniref:Uncharacterized protein n=1 Tax=Candidatus Magasanikbacteria bacterium GW2011_GWC2_37_14 TaxID=1619046 RepID=A0A0G0JIS2_9BACT|nr:MAG: hypothetical protein US42_C0003G0048 [Candidatus Magasanikbacteria bacterium GW2011_GWC2_37_14]